MWQKNCHIGGGVTPASDHLYPDGSHKPVLDPAEYDHPEIAVSTNGGRVLVETKGLVALDDRELRGLII